jgi:hypothetical protein
VRAYLEAKLGQWSQEVPTLVEEDVERMMAQVNSRIEDFQVRLDEIATVFATGEVGTIFGDELRSRSGAKALQTIVGAGMLDISQVTGSIMGKGDWSGFITRLVQQAVLGTLLLALFPPGAVMGLAFIVAEVLIHRHQVGQLRGRTREAIGDKFFEALQKELYAKQADITAGVGAQLDQFAARTTGHLQAQIDDARANQERALTEKRDASFSAEREKARLDAIGAKLQELFDAITRTAFGKTLTPAEIDRLAEGQSLVRGSSAA